MSRARAAMLPVDGASGATRQARLAPLVGAAWSAMACSRTATIGCAVSVAAFGGMCA